MRLYANKKVLVTGGCGFIGSALVRVLASSGALVTVVDNLTTGKKKNLPTNLSNINFKKSSILVIGHDRCYAS